MKFAKLPCWTLSGLVLAAGVAHAAEVNNPNDSIKAGASVESADAKR